MASDKHERTEKPTHKKISEARKEGQIARSQDLAAWSTILVGVVMLQSTAKSVSKFLGKQMTQAADLMAAPDQGKALNFMVTSIAQAFWTILPLILTFMALGVISHFAQVRFVLATKSLKPSFKRMNPITGLKRILSLKSGFEAGKQITKLIAFSFVAYFTLYKKTIFIARNGPYEVHTLISMTVSAVVTFMKFAAALGVVIGIIDYLYQRRQINNNLKMSKHEVKQESRQQDLAPEVRGKIRSKQREMSRNRMMSAIRDADVVIVNPVHIALALKYDSDRGAPKVVAKGLGFIAEKIKERAEEERVPIVQDIPLARALNKVCDIDDEIPMTLFESVARVLAFVFSLRDRGTSAGFHKMPGTPDLEDLPVV